MYVVCSMYIGLIVFLCFLLLFFSSFLLCCELDNIYNNSFRDLFVSCGELCGAPHTHTHKGMGRLAQRGKCVFVCLQLEIRILSFVYQLLFVLFDVGVVWGRSWDCAILVDGLFP